MVPREEQFFHGTRPVAALRLLEMEEERGKLGKNKRGKNFQMKGENENISFNFYLQALV